MGDQELQKINSVFSNKAYNLFDLRSENDRDILDALKELSQFYSSNTSENRRNLRSVIEGRSIAINKKFLDGIKTMERSLNTIYTNMIEMNDAMTEMRKNLSSTKKSTQTLIDKTNNIRGGIQIVSAKELITSTILEKFQLNPVELSSLRAGTMDPDVFAALNKSQDILNNSKSLIQTSWQPTAQDILEQISLYEEAGMERLFRWTQGRCRSIDTIDRYDLLPRAMAMLQNRVSLFRQILEEYSINRRDIRMRKFINVLTDSSTGIDLRATEPERYISDMLAWLHQAIPSEKDLLILLLKNCDNVDDLVQQCLGSICEGFSHPLKVRIEQVLFKEDHSKNCIILHSIFCVLHYYTPIISQMVENSQLNVILTELVEIAERSFLQSLQNRITQLLAKESINPSTNLLPPQASEKIVELLKQLLSQDTNVGSKKNLIEQMVCHTIDPLMMHITESASKLNAVDMSVYLLNNFHFIQESLTLYSFLDTRLERLQAQCAAQMNTLTSEQANNWVTRLNLGTIYTVLESKPLKPLSVVPGMEPDNIAAFRAQLEELLYMPEAYELPQLTLLSSPNHRVDILRNAASVICSIYSRLYECVTDPENNYSQPENLLRRTPDEVSSSLASIF